MPKRIASPTRRHKALRIDIVRTDCLAIDERGGSPEHPHVIVVHDGAGIIGVRLLFAKDLRGRKAR
jgi:hypothetical protein